MEGLMQESSLQNDADAGVKARGTPLRARAPEITIDHPVDGTASTSTGSPTPRSPLSPETTAHDDYRVAACSTRGRPVHGLFLEIPNSSPTASTSSSCGHSTHSPSTNGTGISMTTTSLSAMSSTRSTKASVFGHDGTPAAAAPGLGIDQEPPFSVSPDVLAEMIASKSLAEFQALGRLSGIATGLRTDCQAGLSLDETNVDDLAPSRPLSGGHTDVFDGVRLHRERRAVFGTNRLPDKKIKNVFELMLAVLDDKVLILLSVVAAISLSLGLYQAFWLPHAPGQPRVEWVDGVTIMAAVIIVVVAGALNDYQKERQFARLVKKKEDRMVNVIRSGKSSAISVYDVLAGDIVHLEPGDLIPVDGILVSGHKIRCDESSVTGESDQVTKVGGEEALQRLDTGRGLEDADPFIISGSKVLEGIGTYLVTGVGVNSTHGRLRMGLEERTEATPLQQKLSTVADRIAMAGVTVAIALFLILTVKFFMQLPTRDDTDFEKAQTFLRIFIVSITIVVIAVPEGLPLAVTLALAIAVTRMLEDNNLVRILSACETMGNATTVCSDKTGTLTMNEMKVTAGIVGASGRFANQKTRFSILPLLDSDQSPDQPPSPANTETVRAGQSLGGSLRGSLRNGLSGIPTSRFASSIGSDMRKLLFHSIAINSTAFQGEQDGKTAFIGSKTEAALLTFAAERLGMTSLQEERANANVAEIFPFDSRRKYMATVVKIHDDSYRMYVKGAPEILLEKSVKIVADPMRSTERAEMTEERRKCVVDAIDEYASQSLRTLGLAYRDFEFWPPSVPGYADNVGEDEQVNFVVRELTFLGVMGIQDPLRPGVEDAVALCQHAGVVVRMVTGDNVKTATAIAVASGILTNEGIVMEGPTFRALTIAERDSILPRLQVLARSSPEDKKLLVKRLKDLGETVAVTGDGTNDGPALRAADVGFSMGISGTEVTKEASSIVLMDDNFSSIVKAIEWGRTVNDVIKKFIQFQLTVNITAVTLTFVSAITNNIEECILTPVQLLWVNLIMDTFAALALATDSPNPSVLDRQPERKTAPLVSFTSWKMIIGQAIYQLAVTLALRFAGAGIIEDTRDGGKEALQTLVFNAYVWMQFFNLYNNRRLDNKLNILEGVLHNPFFIAINIIIIVGQVSIIMFGGSALSSTRLTLAEWGISLLIGFMSIPVGILIRLTPDNAIRKLLGLRATASDRPEFQYSLSGEGDMERAQSWNLAIDKVRWDLVLLRQPRSSRLDRIWHQVSALVQGKTWSDHSHSSSDLVPSERTPLLGAGGSSQGSSIRRSRSALSVVPATVMAGIVAGSVAGWPLPSLEAESR